MDNIVTFKVWGKYALFTDPLTKIGGEKFSYPIPTYEALKGVLSSVYWKPTIVWTIEKVRIMKRIQTQTRSAKPLNFDGIYPSAKDPAKKQTAFNTLAIYTYLYDVEYQVQAHFDWNFHRKDMEQDRNDKKHVCVARRMIERGGRRDVFLGTRECQAYVAPCSFGEDSGAYDNTENVPFGLMFHGFDYPDEFGKNEFRARFWRPEIVKGIVEFKKPEECDPKLIKTVRPMKANPPKSQGLVEADLLEGCEERGM